MYSKFPEVPSRSLENIIIYSKITSNIAHDTWSVIAKKNKRKDVNSLFGAKIT